MATQYKVGDRVLLVSDAGQDCLRQYVGKIAILIERYDGPAPAHFRTDVSNTLWWPVATFGSPIYNPDQKCSVCNVSAPHGESKTPEYTCDFCAASKELDATVEEEDCIY